MVEDAAVVASEVVPLPVDEPSVRVSAPVDEPSLSPPVAPVPLEDVLLVSGEVVVCVVVLVPALSPAELS